MILTATRDVSEAVECMRLGASDYLQKPFDRTRLITSVRNAVTQGALRQQVESLATELRRREGFATIIGTSTSIRAAVHLLGRAATSDVTVLLEGESGTGKELFARGLHALSPRADAPFVAINCAAIPDTLLETELFGHEKGAFTGAVARKAGRFELAHRGTLFLDEIGDLPLALQAKILRALEEKRFERVGGTQSLVVDVRVVAATNRNLKQRVAERQFREDLFFRLSVFPIQIPPLRERSKDVVILARHFVDRFCRDLNKKPLTLSTAALDDLNSYSWPGNVRELQNCIERAVILCDGDTIQLRHLNLSFRQPTAAAPVASPWEEIDLSGTMTDALRRVTAEVERRKLDRALSEAAGNKQRAAETLQISYKTLLQKLKEYGIAEDA
jgi:DNA-binding NtrC family response regulator